MSRQGLGERIAPGIVRWRDPRHADEALPPSFAVRTAPPPSGRVEPAAHAPAFALRDTGERPEHEITVPSAEPLDLYGGGEVCGPLRHNGRTIRCWNSEALGYDGRAPTLYQSHPWVLALRPDGTAAGWLLDTTWPVEIAFVGTPGVAAVRFRCPGHSPALYAIDGDGPREVLERLAALTGTMPLPPRWALGYHQSRWSYAPAAMALEVASELRRRRLPCDVIWFDIDYMDGFRCFTFDPEQYPDPAAVNAAMHRDGFRTIWMIDPGIKVDPDYAVYRAGREGEHFVRTATGEEFHGACWPGPAAYPDFTRAATRDWWAALFREFLATGIDGVWNDMNEPSIFDTPNLTMPLDAWHRADAELGGPDVHERYHNVYGALMAHATRTGLARARPERRPFVLTRAAHLGSHRDAAMWTGDNASNEEHLRWSIPMALNLGLSGQPFAGPDIGGFLENATPDLFARWMGIGALLPFARGHTAEGTAPHEPYAFGADCEHACRQALERRYRLLPYLYTAFHEASRTGLPVVRPLFFADPADPRLRAVDDAFLLGGDLLVRAPLGPGSTCVAPLPRDAWRKLALEAVPHAALPELYVRPGAVVPLGPVMQYSDEQPLDVVTLVVNLDADGRARGTLYEDAGDGYAHEQGAFRLTELRAARRDGTVQIDTTVIEGDWRPSSARVELQVLDDDESVSR